MPTRDEAVALDRADPLAAFRDSFFVADEEADVIYANGNSLGRLPLATVTALARVVRDAWGAGLVGSWDSWVDLPERVGDALAAGVLGAGPGECVVADSTTVNLFKLASCVPGVVLTDVGNFPTDRYVLSGLGREVRLLPADPPVEAVRDALAGGDVALVALSHVSYKSGARLDLPAVTAAAHDAGALVLWDVSHSAGSVEIGLSEHGVDLAVGCTYKYLNAGPGAPAFLYVRRELQAELAARQPITGWFGAADQFAMRESYEPAPGIRAFVSGTPSVLGCVAVEYGVRLVAEAGMGALAAKGAALSGFLIDCLDERAASGGLPGIEVATPREPSRRGAHVSLRHPGAEALCKSLISDHGLVCDFRQPDIVRLGLAPLYSRFVDAWDAAERLSGALTP